MYIGILTASRTDNNGTDLQAFAMQRLFNKDGCNCEVIDYISPLIDSNRYLFAIKSPKDLLLFPWKLFQHISHSHFRRKYLIKSKRVYTSDALYKLPYDAVIVGSDQVWNLKLTNNDFGFYLPYKISGKKYSYAVSMGAEEDFDITENERLREWLLQFSGVSVRESSSLHLLSQLGIPARESLDPILCIKHKEWETILPNTKYNGNYVLLYLVGSNSKALKYAFQLKEKFGYRIIRIEAPCKPIRGINTKHFVGLQKWLKLLNSAEIIITNSYHCLSTAIALNKNVRCFGLPDDKNNNRIRLLLKKLNIEEVFSPIEANVTDLNWQRVNQDLAELRRDSEEYINAICLGEDYDK